LRKKIKRKNKQNKKRPLIKNKEKSKGRKMIEEQKAIIRDNAKIIEIAKESAKQNQGKKTFSPPKIWHAS
jgi:hypothetical protein